MKVRENVRTLSIIMAKGVCVCKWQWGEKRLRAELRCVHANINKRPDSVRKNR